MKLKQSILSLLFFIFINGYAINQDTTFLKQNAREIDTEGKEQYFFTKENLSLQEILSKNFTFKKDANLGFVSGFLWVKLVIKNNSFRKQFVLHVSDGHISGLYLYKPVLNGYQMTSPKKHHPEDGREVYNRVPAFFIEMEKGETKVFYLKIDAQNEIVNFNYIVEDIEQYMESVQTDYIIIGFYLGTLLIIIIVNIFYFVALKDRLFLVYAGYVLASMLVTLTLDGFSWLFIPNPDMAYHVSYLCLRLWPESLLFFTIQLVNLKQYQKRLAVVCYLFMFYHLVIMAVLEYLNVSDIRLHLMAQWEIINWGLCILLICLVIAISYKNNKYLFKYYLIAYGVLIVDFLFLSMHRIGAGNWLVFEHGFKAGTLIEMITLSFAVSRRFRLTENDLKNKEEEQLILTDKVNQLEMDVRKAQMNPHFMFNALVSIEYFILKNDPQKARSYLNKFAKLMRLTFDNSMNNYIRLQDELDALKFYVELEFLRLTTCSHSFAIELGQKVDPDNVLIPALLIQPFVENAIWHGLQKKETAGKLIIELKFYEKELVCIIEDDGGGMEKMELPANRKSSGILITKERLNLIHTLLKTTNKFHIDNVKNKNGHVVGTRVEFNMPFIMEE